MEGWRIYLVHFLAAEGMGRLFVITDYGKKMRDPKNDADSSCSRGIF